MPPVVRAAQPSNSGSATSTSFTLALPAARAAGDLLLGVVASSTATAPTRPGTWTGIRSIPDTAFHLDICRLTEAGGAAPAWSKTAACKWAGVILCISAGTWDTTTPITAGEEVGTTQGTSAATAYAAGPVTPATPDCLLVAVYANKGTSTWTIVSTAPAMVLGAQGTATGTAAASIGLFHSSSNVLPTGSAISRTGTASVSAADACTWIAAIRPSAGAPQTGELTPGRTGRMPGGQRQQVLAPQSHW